MEFIESTLEQIKGKNVILETACELIGKKQDYIVSGTSKDKDDNEFDYIAVFDGHGNDHCINYIKSLDIESIVQTEDPIDTIIEKIRRFRIKNNINMRISGSTFSLVKIFTKIGRIELSNVGDSMFMVFIDEKQVFKTQPHTLENPIEVERLKNNEYISKIKPVLLGYKLFPISEKKITQKEIEYANFKNQYSLQPTQCLGHNEETEYQPDVNMILFDFEKRVKIIGGSDGFWDMIIDKEDSEKLLTLNASQLCQFAKSRWLQDWDFSEDNTNLDEFIIGSFENECDDICCGVWEYNPL